MRAGLLGGQVAVMKKAFAAVGEQYLSLEAAV